VPDWSTAGFSSLPLASTAAAMQASHPVKPLCNLIMDLYLAVHLFVVVRVVMPPGGFDACERCISCAHRSFVVNTECRAHVRPASQPAFRLSIVLLAVRRSPRLALLFKSLKQQLLLLEQLPIQARVTSQHQKMSSMHARVVEARRRQAAPPARSSVLLRSSCLLSHMNHATTRALRACRPPWPPAGPAGRPPGGLTSKPPRSQETVCCFCARAAGRAGCLPRSTGQSA
jgi:hypothetical protein